MGIEIKTEVGICWFGDGTFGAPLGMNQRPLNCSRLELRAGRPRVRKRGWVLRMVPAGGGGCQAVRRVDVRPACGSERTLRPSVVTWAEPSKL